MNRRLLTMVVALFIYGAAQAQEFKVGYTYIDFIVFNMPEMAGINSELSTFRGQLESQVTAKQTTIQTKTDQLRQMAQQPNANQTVLQERNNELIQLTNDLETYAAQARQSLSAKEANLMNPVFTKVQTAIDEVRKEKGYNIILNMRTSTSDGIVLAADESLNITEAVFAKLGVEMPKEPSPSDPTTATNPATGNGNGN